MMKEHSLMGEQLLDVIRGIVASYVSAAIQQVKGQWGAYQEDGNAELTSEELIIAQNVVAYTLIATGQKMWILEYGKGSEMDKVDNPFLEDYIDSEEFNYDRVNRNFAILGRPKGEYKDLDGKTHISSGSLEGIDLEHDLGKHLEKYAEGTPYLPSPARRIIDHTLNGGGENGILDEMTSDIQKAILALNFFKIQSSFKIL